MRIERQNAWSCQRHRVARHWTAAAAIQVSVKPVTWPYPDDYCFPRCTCLLPCVLSLRSDSRPRKILCLRAFTFFKQRVFTERLNLARSATLCGRCATWRACGNIKVY